MLRRPALATPMRVARLRELKTAGELAGATTALSRRRELRRAESHDPHPQGVADHDDLVALSAARGARRSYLADLDGLIEADQQEVDAKTAEYQRARQQSKGMEKLVARHYEHMAQQAQRADQDAADEVASQQAARADRGLV